MLRKDNSTRKKHERTPMALCWFRQRGLYACEPWGRAPVLRVNDRQTALIAATSSVIIELPVTRITLVMTFAHARSKLSC